MAKKGPEAPNLILGNLDLGPIRDQAVVMTAHWYLAGNLNNLDAKTLVAQYENSHPLNEALVSRLLKKADVEDFWVTIPVQNGKLRPYASVVVTTPKHRIISFGRLIPKTDKVDPL